MITAGIIATPVPERRRTGFRIRFQAEISDCQSFAAVNTAGDARGVDRHKGCEMQDLHLF
jgi:hypothetical protein